MEYSWLWTELGWFALIILIGVFLAIYRPSDMLGQLTVRGLVWLPVTFTTVVIGVFIKLSPWVWPGMLESGRTENFTSEALYVFFWTCILMPVVEEIIVRGPLLAIYNRSRYLAAWLWLFFSSVLFAAAHFIRYPPYMLTPELISYRLTSDFIWSAAVGVAVFYTRSLVPAIISHSAINFVILINIHIRIF